MTENREPEAQMHALERITAQYLVGSHLRNTNMNLAEALACRAEHAKPTVDVFFV